MSVTYLVGGAVRDQLLGFPYSECDWVVVGSSPKKMLENGFKPVGKDFPVFLHPRTNEEYALARTERKTSPGYSGFSFHTAPDITLEDDLLRRDLTINAIAQTPKGEIIDPYGGQQDIQSKLLRHVSPAFSEDPVRILRVARFAARYHHLGFSIAGETMQLMQAMVHNGEVNHLVAERVWKEFEKALGEESPHVFIEVLRDCGALNKVIPELDQLFDTKTSSARISSLKQACQLTPKATIRFGCLTHRLDADPDINIKRLEALSARLAIPKVFRDLAIALGRDQILCEGIQTLSAEKLLELIERQGALKRPEKLQDFLTACEAESRSKKTCPTPYPPTAYIHKAIALCQQVQASDIIKEGFSGKIIGEKLHERRVDKLISLTPQDSQ